ncbi:MAG: hypothetical protein RL577_1623 [Bacteroidota bacterium]
MKKLVIALGLLFALLLGLFAYSGGFQSIEVKEGRSNAYLIVGFRHQGPFHEIGDKFKLAQDFGTQLMMYRDSAIGIYFDEPGKVAEDSLRSFAGIVVKDSTQAKAFIGFAKGKGQEAVLMRIEAGNTAYVDFKTSNPLSYMIGPLKCYPAIGEHLMAKGDEAKKSVYEIYTLSECTYVFNSGEAH